LKRGLTGGPHLSAGEREGEERWAGRCLRGPKEESGPRVAKKAEEKKRKKRRERREGGSRLERRERKRV
jgi:hypothetical protein